MSATRSIKSARAPCSKRRGGVDASRARPTIPRRLHPLSAGHQVPGPWPNISPGSAISCFSRSIPAARRRPPLGAVPRRRAVPASLRPLDLDHVISVEALVLQEDGSHRFPKALPHECTVWPWPGAVPRARSSERAHDLRSRAWSSGLYPRATVPDDRGSRRHYGVSLSAIPWAWRQASRTREYSRRSSPRG